MIEERIEEINREILKEENRIGESRTAIEEKRKELKELEVLEKRLDRIHHIRFRENLGDTGKIADLANKFCLRDILYAIEKLTGINLNPPHKALPLLNLTIWQGMFLLLGDHTDDVPDQDNTGLSGEELSQE